MRVDLQRARERALTLARWLRGHIEVRLVAALGAASALAWVFAEIVEDMLEGDTRAVDRAVLLALREPGDTSDPLGPLWMHELGRDVTALGGSDLWLLTAAVVGYLWVRRRWHLGWVLVAGVAGADLWIRLLKKMFDRPRPDLVPHLTEVYSASFPSGHSAMSAIYLILGMMLARTHRRRAVRAYIVLVAVLIMLLVGASRVYLGVHWPTDVLAGWALGALWAIVVWTVACWIEGRRGRSASVTGREHQLTPGS